LSAATLRAVNAEASRAEAWKRIEALEADAAHLCAEWTAAAEHWLAAETELAALRDQLADKEAENERLRNKPKGDTA
jgi:chromosome segregation ATPase